MDMNASYLQISNFSSAQYALQTERHHVQLLPNETLEGTFNAGATTFVIGASHNSSVRKQSTTAGNESVDILNTTALYSDVEIGLLIVIFGTIGFLTIAGNLLVILAFARDQKLRSFGNYLILNLSLTDFVVGLLVPVYMPYALFRLWPYGRHFCVVFMLVDYTVPLASSWNLAFISIDRFMSIVKPVFYRVHHNHRLAVGLMIVPWVAGLLVHGPGILFWSEISRSQKPAKLAVDDRRCMVDFHDSVPYLLYGSTLEFLLPLAAVAVTNILLYANLRKRSRASRVAAQRLLAARDNSVNGDLLASSRCQNSRLLATGNSNGTNLASERTLALLARDKRTARSLAVLVIVFALTWGPFELCALLCPLCGACVPEKVFTVTFWLLWCNSTINPVLYPLLQKKFRVAFRNILHCGRSKNGGGFRGSPLVPECDTAFGNNEYRTGRTIY